GNTIGIYHSRFSDAERVETWMNVKKKDGYRVILGVRSSVFLPFEDLGLVIVDEEHENTYKQFDPAPRYNARDAAIMLARLHHAKVLLGTATPSLESYFNVLRGKYGLTELMTRFQDMKLPEIVLADIKEARRKKQIRGHFTPTLLDAMDYALAQGEQVILFQNRRGFSPYIECELCGWVPKCDHCDVSLTYHKGIGKLVCHYCGFSQKTSKNCTVCGSSALSTRGFGTEKIEDDVRAVFPAFKTARLDLDTTRSRQAYEKIIDDFENHKIDILIGTQMVSKGLDFEKVSVVGILNADNMLFYPDFRAYERSFQLMSQVSGRAGRKYRQGKVIIQSSDTEHQIIQYVRRNDFHQMLHTQLAERRKFSYPPYFRLISITLKHKDRQMLDKAAEKLAGSLRNVFPGKILGPEYPYINRIQNMFRKTMLVKIAREGSPVKAKQVLADKINDLTADEKYRAVRVVIDVDPM
ncbi:MAG: primosomal protein N', partial [Bacteroidota bacterium]